MTDISSKLEQLQDIDGFLCAASFTNMGKFISSINTTQINLEELGVLTNKVLAKAKKASSIVDVGHGNLVHIQSSKMHIIARCIFCETQEHIHLILILDNDGNVALGKMKLEALCNEFEK